jgi:hypothetical protein
MIRYLTRTENFQGRRYNTFFIKERLTSETNGNSKWLCVCDCGNDIPLTYREFTQKKDCGCRIGCKFDKTPLHNIEGKRFTSLTVIKLLDKSHAKEGRYWLCKCDCGNEIETTSLRLSIGRVKSCGCLTRATTLRTAARHLYAQYKYNADRRWRTYSFDLPFEEFLRIIVLPCHYCGTEAKEINYKNKKNIVIKLNGIDRVNNNKGYTVNNVVPCCKKCNWMKGKDSTEDFLAHLNLILKHLSNT